MLIMLILVGIFALAILNIAVFSKNNTGTEGEGSNLGKTAYSSEEDKENSGDITAYAGGEEIGDKAKINTVEIIDRATGTGPWDNDDEAGNDSSASNDIVRSFDQVTWTVNAIMGIKEGIDVENLQGGTIEFEAKLPEECAKIMTWDLDSMAWVKDGVLSEDGTTLTGSYAMSNSATTVPGSQTLVFVLKIYGAANGTKIQPTFTFKLAGNEKDEKISKTAETVKVSATGKYNIRLNDDTFAEKVSVDYGNGETSGRMHGFRTCYAII